MESELPCSTAGAEVSELNITAEEADARIVPHVMHTEMLLRKAGISGIIVLSADTDVFVLLVFYRNVLHSHGLSKLWVKVELEIPCVSRFSRCSRLELSMLR